MPDSIALTRLRQALEAFNDERPKNLPPGLARSLDNLGNELGKPSSPDTGSPGQRAVASATYGTGVPMEKAAMGDDSQQGSPGHRAAMQAGSISDDIREKAQRIVTEQQNQQ